MKNTLPLVYAFLFAAFFISCSDDDSSEKKRIELLSESEIQDRIYTTDTDSIIEIESSGNKSTQGKKFKLYFRARVKSPKLQNVSLRATHISMNGNYAFVSYNHEGETYLGGLDVIDLSSPKKPKLISSAIFNDTDVSTVHYDPVSGKLLLATATKSNEFDTPSVIEEVSLNANIPTDQTRRKNVPSFVATDAKTDRVGSENRIYATSGNTGGLSIFNQDNFELIKYIELEDARAVEYTNDYIIVMQGTPARLAYYDRNSYAHLGTFNYDGAHVKEAKSAFWVHNDKVLIGGGDEGVIIAKLFSNQVLNTIPIPPVPGVELSKVQSNSVTINQNLIFIANGEGGAYVADYNEETNEIRLLGRTQFQQKESANFVISKDDWLFIARGKAGFHIVQVEYEN